MLTIWHACASLLFSHLGGHLKGGTNLAPLLISLQIGDVSFPRLLECIPVGNLNSHYPSSLYGRFVYDQVSPFGCCPYVTNRYVRHYKQPYENLWIYLYYIWLFFKIVRGFLRHELWQLFLSDSSCICLIRHFRWIQTWILKVTFLVSPLWTTTNFSYRIEF